MSRQENALPQEDSTVKIGERRQLAGWGGHVSWSSCSTDGMPQRRELLSRGGGNTMCKLMRREIGRLPPRPDVTFYTEKFRRFKLQEEFGVYDGMDASRFVKRSITRIIAANDFIFVIDCRGFCAAFCQTANGSIIPYYKRDGQIWHFNHNNEMINTLFYNRAKDSVIIVSSGITSGGLQMRAIPLESVRRCDNRDDGVPLFGPEQKYSLFLDDCNNIAVAASMLFSEPQVGTLPATICVNNIYDMNSYNLVHSIAGDILSITSRPGILIAAYNLIGGHLLPIEVFSTENWRVLKRINYSIPLSCKVLQTIEVYKDNILLKEKGKDMQIIDIWNHNNVNILKQTKDQQLLVNFELYANRILLKFNNDIIMASNSHGEQVSLLEDNEAVGNNWGCVDTHVTKDKNYAICYSRKFIEKPRHGTDILQEDSCIGSINICNSLNGESIWKINPCDDVDLAIIDKRKDADNNGENFHCSINEALENVTAIFYDEEHHRIYTGNKRGFIHVWSN